MSIDNIESSDICDRSASSDSSDCFDRSDSSGSCDMYYIRYSRYSSKARGVTTLVTESLMNSVVVYQKFHYKIINRPGVAGAVL